MHQTSQILVPIIVDKLMSNRMQIYSSFQAKSDKHLIRNSKQDQTAVHLALKIFSGIHKPSYFYAGSISKQFFFFESVILKQNTIIAGTLY